MAQSPPPYSDITGITRTVMKDNAQETIANYNGNARPGEIVVNLLNNDVYIGNTSGNLALISTGSGVSNIGPSGPINSVQLNAGGNLFTGSANLTFSSNILTVNGNSVVTSSSSSFDPQFTDASATTAGATATGNYTLHGSLCYFRVYIDFATCTNFGTGQYQITLPFPSIETMRQAGGTLHAVTANALYHIAGITDNAVSTTVHKLYYSGSTTDLAWKYNTPVGATTVASHFDISGIYQIA